MGHETEHKSFGDPDETREFRNGKAEILSIGGAAPVVEALTRASLPVQKR